MKGRQQSWRHGLFGTPLNAVLTLVVLALAAWVVPAFLRWAVFNAVWRGASSDACGHGGGACWAMIAAKFRFILFGLYPPEERWRPGLVLVILIGLVLATAWPRLWSRRMAWVWVGAIIVAVGLMAGGLPGMPLVGTDRWGGLPLTLLMTVVAVAGAFPLSLALALGRRSRMGGVRWLSIAFIEVVRGVPTLGILYAATLLFPLMLPAGAGVDKLLRVQVAFTCFVAAYLAEILRAGFQAVPSGQIEAAQALGLGRGLVIYLVLMPQALRIVVPALVTLCIGMFQETTLVTVIGVFDFMATAHVSASDPDWMGYYDEAHVFAAAFYFVVCYGASRYSRWLERHLAFGHRVEPAKAA